jgi:long-chain acyl-CoA synthetase
MEWREAEASFDHPVLEDSTLSRAFEDSASRHEHQPAQLYKGDVYDRSLVAGDVVDPAPPGEFASLTYGQFRQLVRHLAAGFRDLGVESDDRVGIFAHTRMEWAQCDFGLLAAGAVVTAVYPTSSVEQVAYLLADADVRGVVVENARLLDRVLAVVDDTARESADDHDTARESTDADDVGEINCDFAVVMDEFDAEELTHDLEATPIEVHSLADVHQRGVDTFDRERYEAWLDARELSDLASLIYTSGTTGRPKGVRLTHGNFRANVNQCFRRFGPRPGRPAEQSLDADDRALSFLPLSHVFERLAGHFLLILTGATVGYAESPDTLREDFPAVEPTIGTSVPRVYEKLYETIQESASESRLKRRLFEWAVDVGTERFRAETPGLGLRLRHAVADRLVFRQVRRALGGEVNFFISGGGSLSPKLCTLYHAMGIPILEGYGLTETAPVLAANPPEAPTIGTIGPPVQEVDVRLDTTVGTSIAPVDGGEVGELLVRGPNVTDGYWNDPEATAAAFTDDGWLRTGDVVERRPDEYLRFRERAKEILALSTGKKVAPVPLEEALLASPLIEQAMVLGDARKFVAALLVPNVAAVRAWAAEEGIDLPADTAAICEDQRVRDRIETVVEGVNAEVEPHERIKRFRLVPEEFTEENDLLTPTMKKKRRAILDRHAEAVDWLYEE